MAEHLHDQQAVVADEAGDVKKGTRTVGVRRLYTGTAGRIENSQVSVYLVHASRRGHAAVDRELYGAREYGPGRDLFISVEPAFAPTRSPLSPDGWSTTQYRTSRIVLAPTLRDELEMPGTVLT